MEKKKSKRWVFVSAGLAAAAFFLRFALRGYAWWGYALLFAAALIVLYHIAPPLLWKIVVALTCLGLL